MNKKEFKDLISKHRDILHCVVIRNVTTRRDHPHCAVFIIWNTGIDHKTTVRTMRGKDTDLKNIEILNKYLSWLD